MRSNSSAFAADLLAAAFNGKAAGWQSIAKVCRAR
jgi:hypothetical protein